MKQLHHQDYFTLKAENAYLCHEQLIVYNECPARWKASLSNDYIPNDQYTHLHDTYIKHALTRPSHEFDRWREDNKSRICSKYGKHRVFDSIDEGIEAARHEPLIMKYLSGSGQVVYLLDDFQGVPFKAKFDVINYTTGFITELIALDSISKPVWRKIDGRNIPTPFYEALDCWTKLALLRAVAAVVYPEMISMEVFVVSFEKKFPYNRDVLDMTVPDHLAQCLDDAIVKLHQMQQIKIDNLAPELLPHCNTCEYCIETKLLTEPTKIFPTEVE